MTQPVTPALVGRLAAIALLGAILQVTAVSQITVFGVPADVTPLLVVSVGLLLGSTSGATFGFAAGLLVDTGMLQTLGVTSLLLVAVGYGAGRLRELRDPAHGLAPMAVGAVAAAVTSIGYAVLQFLPDDPRRRRRRAYTTGGLSPLSRA